MPQLEHPTQRGADGELCLPVLSKPDVPSSKQVWEDRINVLSKLPGVNEQSLRQVGRDIDCGVKVEFSSTPPPHRAYNNTFSFTTNAVACAQRLDEYMSISALRWASLPPPPGGYPYIQPLHAVIKSGKKPRVCVDLGRNFNDYLTDKPFKMSGIRDAVHLSSRVKGPVWYVKMDISACFLSFPVHPEDIPYFRCKAPNGKVLEFLSMVFGSKPAPYICTRLLDVISSELVDMGVDHVRYLDDFLLIATTREAAIECAVVAASIIKKFGLALSPEKTEGPSQELEFLGIVIDSRTRTLSISKKRKKELLDILTSFSSRIRASVSKIQSLLGKLAFAAQVLPGAKPFTRRIIDVIRGRHHRAMVDLDEPFQLDVSHWKSNIESWNGTQRWRADFSSPVVFGSDASTEGFGYGLESVPASVLQRLPAHMAPGNIRVGVWSGSNGDAARQRTHRRIQWGEMFCTLAAATEYGGYLKDQHVVFVVDNDSDVGVINRQSSRNPDVCCLLRSLCRLSLHHNFSFSAVHRKGDENALMDWASRPSVHRFSLSSSSAAEHVRASRSVVGQTVKGNSHTHSSLLESSYSTLASSIPCTYPPLLTHTSATLVNSRCVRPRSQRKTGAGGVLQSSGW